MSEVPVEQVVLVVDVANVMGCRPDGWWRRRAAAAAELVAAMAGVVGARLAVPELGDRVVAQVVAVVEGQARGVAQPEGVQVVAAAGSGDDEIAAQAMMLPPPVVVVTADKLLRQRCAPAVCVSSSWFRGVLDQQG